MITATRIMAYEFHITRREYWEDDGPAITADEWLQYVKNDPELKIIEANGRHFVHWTGPSKLSEPWLDWLDGEIFTEDPDKALVDKMIAIAQNLKAEVQGDDGEAYADSSDVPDPGESDSSAKPFWKRWFG